MAYPTVPQQDPRVLVLGGSEARRDTSEFCSAEEVISFSPQLGRRASRERYWPNGNHQHRASSGTVRRRGNAALKRAGMTQRLA
jgi:hypothetical protein